MITCLCTCCGSPLAIGHGDKETFIGSDALALAPFTSQITYLEEGDWAVLYQENCEIIDHQNKPVQREKKQTCQGLCSIREIIVTLC